MELQTTECRVIITLARQTVTACDVLILGQDKFQDSGRHLHILLLQNRIIVLNRRLNNWSSSRNIIFR